MITKLNDASGETPTYPSKSNLKKQSNSNNTETILNIRSQGKNTTGSANKSLANSASGKSGATSHTTRKKNYKSRPCIFCGCTGHPSSDCEKHYTMEVRI